MQRASETSLSLLSTSSVVDGELQRVCNLMSFAKGFMFSFLSGTIHFYEKETPHRYKKRNVLKIPDHTVQRDTFEEESVVKLNDVNCIAINSAEDRIIATCNQTQIYTAKLWGADLTAMPETPCVELGSPLHHGAIGGLAVCYWKPIFLTSGEWDKTLRIWNYDTERLELWKEFQEDVYGLSLHPTGLYAVVGFSDKLRFLTILIDDFSNTREFPVRNCKLCMFSTLGHVFGAVNGNIIQVYSCVTLSMLFVLKGHSGKVRYHHKNYHKLIKFRKFKITDMSWTTDDRQMASCGTEGAVYGWDIPSVSRITEVITKSCSFTSVAITSDGASTFAVGSDGYLRELIGGNIHREVMLAENGVDLILLSNSDMMLFASANNGVVYSIKLPILDVAEYQEFAVHSCTVNRVSYDRKICFCLWRNVFYVL